MAPLSKYPWICTGEDSPIQQIGCKAANLLQLRQVGQEVPPFYTVTAAAFQHVMAHDGIDQATQSLVAMDKEPEIIQAAANIRAAIANCNLPPELQQQVRNHHENIFVAEEYVAVRSSALDEDSAEKSFAGMHDSFLFVRGEDDILQAIRNVWASAFNERAVVYRLRSGLSLGQIVVAVVVQKMIDAARSGVIFTCNPGTNSVHQVVVSSLYGVGEGLVSAGLEADTFTVEKESLEFTSEIAPKCEQLVLNTEQGGLKREAVPEALRVQSSLTDDEVRDVVRVAIRVEQHFGRPQDIEFCFDHKNRLFLLQSRPVTNIEENGPAAGNRLVWDNSNIVESYSGVTSPMTFSFIRRAYTIVYHCFAEVMGISPSKVRGWKEITCTFRV